MDPHVLLLIKKPDQLPRQQPLHHQDRLHTHRNERKPFFSLHELVLFYPLTSPFISIYHHCIMCLRLSLSYLNFVLISIDVNYSYLC
uniref:Uncharacterized protein n=1 Tax=Caenorhabditis japonica TaxID=281687 RepID=A0A2Q4TJU0_CAEJA